VRPGKTTKNVGQITVVGIWEPDYTQSTQVHQQRSKKTNDKHRTHPNKGREVITKRLLFFAAARLCAELPHQSDDIWRRLHANEKQSEATQRASLLQSLLLSSQVNLNSGHP
jgi:hypothetical protein